MCFPRPCGRLAMKSEIRSHRQRQHTLQDGFVLQEKHLDFAKEEENKLLFTTNKTESFTSFSKTVFYRLVPRQPPSPQTTALSNTKLVLSQFTISTTSSASLFKECRRCLTSIYLPQKHPSKTNHYKSPPLLPAHPPPPRNHYTGKVTTGPEHNQKDRQTRCAAPSR